MPGAAGARKWLLGKRICRPGTWGFPPSTNQKADDRVAFARPVKFPNQPGEFPSHRLQTTDSATLVSDQVKVTARAEGSDIAIAKQFGLTVEQADSE